MFWIMPTARRLCQHHRHHHNVPEGLGMFPAPCSSRWSWSLHLFLGRPMFLRPFGIYCSACFGSLCPSFVRVVATFRGTVLFPLLCADYVKSKMNGHIQYLNKWRRQLSELLSTFLRFKGIISTTWYMERWHCTIHQKHRCSNVKR